jgi:TetR/AcrR family transcriptional regulator, lmrAB and yxaGH operons repressor
MTAVTDADPRTRMIQSAVYLLAREGYQGTSFSAVLKHSGAPRGSVYYHFPEGKDQLIAAAVDATLQRGIEPLQRLRGKPLASVLRGIIAHWRELLERSDCRAACPVIATSVGATNPDLLAHVADAMKQWREHYRRALEDAGVPARRCAEVAALLLSGCEGAMHLARAEQSLTVFDDATRTLKRQIIAATAA